MSDLWLPSDEAWTVLEPHLPKNRPGGRRSDDRRVISGILHVLQSGCRWQDIAPPYRLLGDKAYDADHFR
jgi:transposase